MRIRGRKIGAGTVFGWALALLLFSTGLTASSAAPKNGNGVAHQQYTLREVPWSIQVVRIAREQADLEMISAMGDGTRIGLSPLTDQLRRLPKALGVPLAAINGDFYQTEGDEYQGDPRGLQISDGELVSSPSGATCFWIDADGDPMMGEVQSKFSIIWPGGQQTPFALNEDRGREAVLYTPAIGRSTKTSGGVEFVLEMVDSDRWLPLNIGEVIPARIQEIRNGGNSRVAPNTLVLSLRSLSTEPGAKTSSVGDLVAVSTETSPTLRGIQTAVGGGPALVRDSQIQPARVSKSRDRHPRSAVGWNKKEIFFVQVDGRQPRHSMGMTLPELAEFMSKLGCENAMNLDGGGSSEIWMDGRILNRPCFGHERSTGNSLVVVQKDSEARP